MNLSERRVKRIREYYPEKEVFEEAIEDIKVVFGLELSLIEKLRLKEYVSPVLDSLDRMAQNAKPRPSASPEWAANSFHPVVEVVSRFMEDYYGLPSSYSCVSISNENVELYSYNPESFKKYMRILQERFHKP